MAFVEDNQENSKRGDLGTIRTLHFTIADGVSRQHRVPSLNDVYDLTVR
jgi:hypothetical protein